MSNEELYRIAAAFVAAVNDPAVSFKDDQALERDLDRACAAWAKERGYTREPTGRLLEAAMNGWPLP